MLIEQKTRMGENIWNILNNKNMKHLVFSFAFFLNVFENVMAQKHNECVLEKKDFYGYYIISFKNKELKKKHSSKKDIHTMIDYTTQVFLVDVDSFNLNYIKRAMNGKTAYVSVSSDKNMLRFINDYACADDIFIMGDNLQDTLRSKHYYTIKGIKGKSFRVKYVEGEARTVQISKRKFLSLFKKPSDDMILTDPMVLCALVKISQTREMTLEQLKALKIKKNKPE